MQADPNLIMLDQLVRVCLAELIKACIWVGIGSAALRLFFWKRPKRARKRHD